MDKYISVEEAKKFFNLYFGSVSHAVIAARLFDVIPAADVVEVVRCKDCKYYQNGVHFKDMMFCCRLKNLKGETARYIYSENDFCSYGERKEGAKNE